MRIIFIVSHTIEMKKSVKRKTGKKKESKIEFFGFHKKSE